eukprot:scaffold31792_cov168-Amphora_coffeaeformis.AAC.19
MTTMREESYFQPIFRLLGHCLPHDVFSETKWAMVFENTPKLVPILPVSRPRLALDDGNKHRGGDCSTGDVPGPKPRYDHGHLLVAAGALHRFGYVVVVSRRHGTADERIPAQP